MYILFYLSKGITFGQVKRLMVQKKMKKPASVGLGSVGLEMCSEEGAAHMWSPNTPHLFTL